MSDGRQLHVIVLIDALGWDYADRFGFLSDVLPHRAPLRTVLGYSSGAIPTILTGKPPVEHGHWNLFYYDPEHSPFRWLRRLPLPPAGALGEHLTRRLLKGLGRTILGLGPLFECCVSPRLLPWFNWAEPKNIYEPGGISGAPSIFDELAAAGVPSRVYTYHRYGDAEMLDRARRDVEADGARFFFLYLSEIDAFLHQHCEDDALVADRLARYGAALRDLLAALRRRDPDARFTVLSDHGMTPVRDHHDLASDLEALDLRMPDDYLAVYDSTMARFWLFSDRARCGIMDRLADLGYGRVLSDDELRALGIDFPDRRYGHLVYLMQPGGLISSSDFNGPRWRPTGMHGYHPDDPSSDAVFLSTHEAPVPMRTIADAHACLRQAAGWPPAPAEVPSATEAERG